MREAPPSLTPPHPFISSHIHLYLFLLHTPMLGVAVVHNGRDHRSADLDSLDTVRDYTSCTRAVSVSCTFDDGPESEVGDISMDQVVRNIWRDLTTGRGLPRGPFTVIPSH